MKKGIVTIIALLYLSITSGVEVNWHYCMGRLAEIEWGKNSNDLCARCGMKDKKGCCETIAHFVKVSDAHQMVKVNYDFTFMPEVPVYAWHSLETLPANIFLPVESGRGPPPLTSQQILRLYQIFRI